MSQIDARLCDQCEIVIRDRKDADISAIDEIEILGHRFVHADFCSLKCFNAFFKEVAKKKKDREQLKNE